MKNKPEWLWSRPESFTDHPAETASDNLAVLLFLLGVLKEKTAELMIYGVGVDYVVKRFKSNPVEKDHETENWN